MLLTVTNKNYFCCQKNNFKLKRFFWSGFVCFWKKIFSTPFTFFCMSDSTWRCFRKSTSSYFMLDNIFYLLQKTQSYLDIFHSNFTFLIKRMFSTTRGSLPQETEKNTFGTSGWILIETLLILKNFFHLHLHNYYKKKKKKRCMLLY